MAQLLRRFDPRTIYFITSHTAQSRYFMAPSDKMNQLIGGILARAVHQCEVELFAHAFASNHFHLLVRAPSSRAMSIFMQRLRSGIGMKVGQLVGWRGGFFAGRYRAEPIVDERDQLDHLVFLLDHSVDEGLVSAPWPGLSCVQSLLEDQATSVHRWRDLHESLTLAPLPGWLRLDPAERGLIIGQLAADIDRSHRSRPWKRERKRASGRAALPQLRAAAV
ncbi:MAG TPA: transposase [Myxococcales bacterium]|jgi:REP element-mobilizing transposase RayT|nr:transposase [Myxococcales bacterium]